MSRSFIIIAAALALAACLGAVNAKQGFGAGEQDWGFVDVRDGAHMFYWLYYTTAHNLNNYTDRPLAIWLQGGPGASSTGYGNFEELGPQTLEGNYREHTWVKDMNVLFIDNPVGSGFSYVDSVTKYTTTNKQIALDLVSFMKGFYKKHPEFEKVPLHIFCESYGGKMAPEFALELYYAIQRGELRSNFSSVALGDPWTSPMDSMWAWGPLLLNMGIVDHAGYERIQAEVLKTEKLVQAEKWTQATSQWGYTESVIMVESQGVDFYNIEKPTRANSYAKHLLKAESIEERMYRTLVHYDIDENRDAMLQTLMRGDVSKALNIPSNVKWGSQSSSTFSMLSGDFMKPVITVVEELLNKTDLKVSVFTGQLDLICATAGTVNWVNKMRWNYTAEYERSQRVGISIDRILEGYQKSARKFNMFWIDRAGHMVPADNPAGMSHILRTITNFG